MTADDKPADEQGAAAEGKKENDKAESEAENKEPSGDAASEGNDKKADDGQKEADI